MKKKTILEIVVICSKHIVSISMVITHNSWWQDQKKYQQLIMFCMCRNSSENLYHEFSQSFVIPNSNMRITTIWICICSTTTTLPSFLKMYCIFFHFFKNVFLFCFSVKILHTHNPHMLKKLLFISLVRERFIARWVLF